MKKLLVILATLFLVACSDVPSGYVGIKVNLLGGDKGVDTQELGTGRYWIGWNEKLYTFPTFSQNQVWTKDETEGSPNDDSMTFQTIDGLEVNTDVGISYHIDPKMVSVVFQKYRKGVEEITNIYIRSAVRNALVNAASTKKIETVYGSGKTELLAEVTKSVRDQCVEFGIIIDQVYWIGRFRLPETITQSINDKAAATQKTQQREQEIQQSKAEADKKIEEARGDAESTLLRANAEAQAITVKGKAISDNPLVIQLNSIEKWNGQLPSTMIPGSSTPFVTIK
jgi:regulator of protease activity HflC (stomatin/prohibitin superfamily)